MKVIIHCKTSILLLLVLFTLVSCKDDFKVYPVKLDISETNGVENKQYIRKVDFRFLERENKLFNTLIFTIASLDSVFAINSEDLKFLKLDEQLNVDIGLIYKNKKYKTSQKFLSIHDMYEGQPFTVECGTELMDKKSALYSFFQEFDSYNTRERIEILKQELPKIKLYISFRNESMELTVTNKTKAVYTKVPNHMRNIISITYD